ncbi:MAG: VWA domain-containing protein, partial [Planctomycetota bacterium]
MRFLHPTLLAWLGVLAAPIVLYLFRRKPREVRVSTLLFFKTLARAYQESAWLRWLKRIVSFLLTVAVLLCGVFALARLVVSPRAGDLKGVVVLVDRSASMAAKDSGGTTRLEEGLRAARARLAGLGGGVAVAVMTYDRRPEILLPFTLDRRDAERALDTISVRAVEGDAPGALALARRLAAIESPAAVWHVSDNDVHHQDTKDTKGTMDDADPPSGEEAVPLGDLGVLVVDAVAVEDISVPLASPVNAGLTAFQLRRLPLERGKLEAFIQVHCAADGPREVSMQT